MDETISVISRNFSNTGYDASTGLFNSDLLKAEDVLSPTMAFWMPSLRYVEHNLRLGWYFRPCQPGREPTSASEYLVQFIIEWPSGPNVESSPQVQYFENARQSQRPRSSPTSFRNFDDDFFVRLRCFKDKYCDGWIWGKVSNYIPFIQFPEFLRQEDPREFWKATTNAAIQLLDSWKLKPEDIGNG